MEQLNIVELIENNPITKLTNTYNIKLLDKIKSNFTDFEQQLFVSSFYCYLNYDKTKDFVIDMDNIWKWLGFNQKVKAVSLLEKQFVIDIDYKIISLFGSNPENIAFLEGKAIIQEENITEEKKTRGGHNIKKFMLNIKCFKLLCMKAQTKKADQIHDYYIKMEETIQEVVDEESTELKLQLQQKENIILEIKETTQLEKYELLEKTILLQFPVNTECIYIGKIDDKTLGRPGSKMYHESVIKFGQTNELCVRIKDHKKSFTNFKLIAAFKVNNKVEIENSIKRHEVLKKRIRSLDLPTGHFKELLALNEEDYTLDKILELIKQIIKEKQYNIENYNLMIERNYELENEIISLKKENKTLKKEKEEINIKLQNYKPDITNKIKDSLGSDYNLCKSGYYLYAFGNDLKYKCSICRQSNLEQTIISLKGLDKDGEMVYYTTVYYTFTEKIMNFLLSKVITNSGNNTFTGSFENVKKIIDIVVKLEKLLMNNTDDLDKMTNILDDKNIEYCQNSQNPEIPTIRKAKRAIDQINPTTNEFIATFESIEAAGRVLGCSGSLIGIALRNKTTAKGFIWRHAGISKEDQFLEQPVIKFNCKTGETFYFSTIAEAATNANISPPALRNRIFTHLHTDNFHWEFDKSATHIK